jgi:hypothetical protein
MHPLASRNSKVVEDEVNLSAELAQDLNADIGSEFKCRIWKLAGLKIVCKSSESVP